MAVPRQQPASTPISLAYKKRSLLLGELAAQDVSQAELARRIGKTQKHVSQVLTARVAMSDELADEMLAALGREWTPGTAWSWGSDEAKTENWRI